MKLWDKLHNLWDKLHNLCEKLYIILTPRDRRIRLKRKSRKINTKRKGYVFWLVLNMALKSLSVL